MPAMNGESAMPFLLLAETLVDQLNNHPAAPFVFYVVLIIAGTVWIFRGLNAIKTKRFLGKRGNLNTGKSAVMTGKFFVGLGGLMAGIGAALLLFNGVPLLWQSDAGSQTAQGPAARRIAAQQRAAARQRERRRPTANPNAAKRRAGNIPSPANASSPSTNSRSGNTNTNPSPRQPTSKPRGKGNKPVTPPRPVVVRTAKPPATTRLPGPTDDSLRPVQSMPQAKNVSSLAFSPDGRLLLSADGRQFPGTDRNPWHVYIWDVESGQLQRKMELQHAADRVRFAPEGDIVAVSDHGAMLTLWEIPSGKLVRSIGTKALPGHPIGFGFDFDFLGGSNTLILVGTGGTAIVDVKTAEVTRSWKNHLPITFAVEVTRDGTTAFTGGSKHEFLVLSMPAGGIISRIPAASKQVESIALSNDGRRAIVRSHRAQLSIWDIEKRENLFAIPESAARGRAIAISPDGSRVATTMSSPPAVHIWDVDSATVLAQFNGHSRGVSAVAISPDGRLGASGDFNGQIQLWKMPD